VKGRTFVGIFAVTAASAGLAAVAACGSFDEAAEAAPDAGGPTLDAADGSLPSDGSAPPTAGAHRCEGREHVFDDFGRAVAAPANGWTLASGAVVAIEDAGPTPPAFFSATPTLPAGQSADNTIGRLFVLGGDTRVCIELDLLFENGEGMFTKDSYAEIVTIHPPAGPHDYVEMRAEGFSLVRTADPVFVPAFVPGKWQHFVVQIQYGPTGQPSLEVDDAPAVLLPSTSGEVPPTVDVRLGLAANARQGTTAAVRAHVDNFRFTSE
jgi:hypothetical protein